MIIITNSNIHDLVETYLENPQELPEDMRNISAWDVSRVTDMNNLFRNAYTFNKSIFSHWDT